MSYLTPLDEKDTANFLNEEPSSSWKLPEIDLSMLSDCARVVSKIRPSRELKYWLQPTLIEEIEGVRREPVLFSEKKPYVTNLPGLTFVCEAIPHNLPDYVPGEAGSKSIQITSLEGLRIDQKDEEDDFEGLIINGQHLGMIYDFLKNHKSS